ncbi:UNVERIFIED_CONTAM: hypothetical protein NCL1_14404 [Trichonephila clavipes]
MAKIKPHLDSGVHKKEYFPLKCDNKDSFHLQTASNTTIDMSKVYRKESNATKCGDLKVFIGLVLYFLKKCWMSCSAAVFVVFVIYWCYGGLIAFILFMFALSGTV